MLLAETCTELSINHVLNATHSTLEQTLRTMNASSSTTIPKDYCDQYCQREIERSMYHWNRGEKEVAISILSRVHDIAKKHATKFNEFNVCISDLLWSRALFFMLLGRYADAKADLQACPKESYRVHVKLLQCEHFLGDPRGVIQQFWEGLSVYKSLHPEELKYRRGFKKICGVLWVYRVAAAHQFIGEFAIARRLLFRLVRSFSREAKLFNLSDVFEEKYLGKCDELYGCSKNLVLQIIYSWASWAIDWSPTNPHDVSEKSKELDFVFECLKKAVYSTFGNMHMYTLLIRFYIDRSQAMDALEKIAHDLFLWNQPQNLGKLLDAVDENQRGLVIYDLLVMAQKSKLPHAQEFFDFLVSKLPGGCIINGSEELVENALDELFSFCMAQTDDKMLDGLLRQDAGRGVAKALACQ